MTEPFKFRCKLCDAVMAFERLGSAPSYLHEERESVRATCPTCCEQAYMLRAVLDDPAPYIVWERLRVAHLLLVWSDDSPNTFIYDETNSEMLYRFDLPELTHDLAKYWAKRLKILSLFA